MDHAELVKEQLECLGYSAVIENHGDKRTNVVVIEYEVQIGRFKDKMFRMGISMQGAEGYPEYPPHFIHLSPPIEPQDGRVYAKYSLPDGEAWVVLSRAPNDIWDSSERNMKTYMEHIARFWSNV